MLAPPVLVGDSVRLEVQSGQSVDQFTKLVVPRDYLIVSLGDSYASGEGNPDLPGDADWQFPLNPLALKAYTGPCSGSSPAPDDCAQAWQDNRPFSPVALCHRSGKAGPARAAAELEVSDPHSSVTFIHLACSGATISKGILSSYLGVNIYKNRKAIDPQIQSAKALVLSSGRTLDFVSVSIGGNDIGFGDIIEKCAGLGTPVVAGDCQSDKKFTSGVHRNLTALSGLYDQLASKLRSLILDPSRVLITEYPDLTRYDDGDFAEISPTDARQRKFSTTRQLASSRVWV